METDGAVVSEAAGSLPVALTSLVGRQRELRDLAALLRATRLLTLVGTGGSGKTRLSIALASAARQRFSHGAWWVDLASVTGRDRLPGTVAAALGVPQAPGQDTAATVVRHLRSRTALLVFDNCEQVVTGCAELVERLLTSCPGLTIVATSREMLGVPGERVFPVDGLGLPAQDEDAAEAVQLFVERARAITPGYTVGPADRAAVARLCRQLDGLPLAIELAAARAGILGAEQIARRLRRDTGVLRNPSRNAPERHQTLHATLEWSYRLLSGKEQVLFRRLSCFSGSFSLSAAEAVTALDGIKPADVAGLVAALVGKSLLLVAGPGGESDYRYRMLETIRQYSAHALAVSGEETAVHAAHAAYYLSLAARAQAGLEGADQARWLDQLERDHDNIRAVLERTLGSSEPAAASAVVGGAGSGARAAALMWPFWYRRGYYHEARAWLEKAAETVLREPVAAPVMAAVLTGAGVLAFLQCDYAVAAERLTKARAVYEEEGDQVGLATTLQRLGSIAREEGRYADARTLHEESLAIWEGLADPVGVAASRDYLAFAAWLAGEADRAVELSGKAVTAFRTARLRQETSAALVNHGVAVWLSGDPERGGALLQESLDIATRLGYREGIAWALNELAMIIAGDDPETAADMLAESLEIHASLGDRWRVASVVEAIAGLAARPAGLAGPAAGLADGPAVGPAVAASILGGAAALRGSLGTPVPPAERTARDRCVRSLREQLGRRFQATWERGQAMTLDELVDLSLRAARAVQDPLAPEAGLAADPAGQPDAVPADGALHGLTERELDVLRLLGEGLTNREIGVRLRISTGTAGVHVSNILRKLGASSRAQAVGTAHRLGLGEG